MPTLSSEQTLLIVKWERHKVATTSDIQAAWQAAAIDMRSGNDKFPSTTTKPFACHRCSKIMCMWLRMSLL